MEPYNLQGQRNVEGLQLESGDMKDRYQCSLIADTNIIPINCALLAFAHKICLDLQSLVLGV